MENKIRNTLNDIYFSKTRDIVNGLRSVEPLTQENKKVMIREALEQAIGKRQQKT